MPSSTPESPSTERETGGRSYGRLVWTQFRRDRFAFISLHAIGLLFMVAALAPFLAGNKPVLLIEGGRWSSPLLREFFAPSETSEVALECVFNYALLLGALSWLLLRPLRGLLRRLGTRPRRRTWLIAIGVLAGLCALPFLLVQTRLDKRHYRLWTAGVEWSAANFAVFPPLRFGPLEQPTSSYRPPSARHPFGTDNVGRDVLSRLIHGSRVSLSVGFVSVAIAVSIGLFLGSLAAYHGGWLDFLISRFIEIVICFPTFLLILTIVAFLEKRSIFNIMLVIGLTGWTGVARLVRGQVLGQRRMDYVVAAQALGASHWRIIFRHLLPNSIAPVLVAATFGVAGAILTEAGLSFIGFGVQPPTPSWGEMLNQARAWPSGYLWLTVWPGVAIFLTVTIYNLVGEGLRDALDPRLKI